MLIRSETISQIDHFEPHINLLIGVAVIVALLAYLAWVSIGHRDARVQGFRLELPGFSLTLGQIFLGVIDLCSAAGVLYVLLPVPRQLDFLTFAAIYVFGCVLGIASHAPGGIGVFEATMLKFVPVPSQEALLASLLLFRIIYYLAPFVLALTLLGAKEGFRHWRGLREAMHRVVEAENKKRRSLMRPLAALLGRDGDPVIRLDRDALDLGRADRCRLRLAAASRRYWRSAFAADGKRDALDRIAAFAAAALRLHLAA